MANMEIVAETRSAKEAGTSESRRLRRAGLVPGVLYGGKGETVLLKLDHKDLGLKLRVEAFHSSILQLRVNGAAEPVLLRDVQRHVYKPQILSVDFQRVDAAKKMTVKVPLHFVRQELSPAVKISGAVVSHVVSDIDVICLPKDLPSFIEVDLSSLEIGQPLHLNDLSLPTGVTALQSADNPVIATAKVPGASEEPEAETSTAPTPAAPAGKKQ